MQGKSWEDMMARLRRRKEWEKNMTRKKKFHAAILAAAIAGLGWSAPRALADSVTIDFNSITTGVVSGDFVLDLSANGNGTYTATSGGGDVTYTPGDNIALTLASKGTFASDNLIDPSLSTIVDSSGLAFSEADSSTPVLYYAVGDSLEWQAPTGSPVAVEDFGGFSFAVPLPASAGVGFSLLGGFGALAMLRKRLKRMSRIA